MNLGSESIHIEREIAYEPVQFGSGRVIALEPDFDQNRSGGPGRRINGTAIPGIQDQPSCRWRRDGTLNRVFSLRTQARCTSYANGEY